MPEKKPNDDEDIALSVDELEALIDKVVDRHEKRNKPKPWDGVSERRVAERRKAKPPKYKRIGGLISYKE